MAVLCCYPPPPPWQAVLYGIFPAVLVGAGLTWLVILWKRRPLKVLSEAHADMGQTWGNDLKTIYRFSNKEEVRWCRANTCGVTVHAEWCHHGTVVSSRQTVI
jgi:hypothetical protein